MIANIPTYFLAFSVPAAAIFLANEWLWLVIQDDNISSQIHVKRGKQCLLSYFGSSALVVFLLYSMLQAAATAIASLSKAKSIKVLFLKKKKN